jgi:DNA-binding PadR family transcriptional regulator
MGPGTLYGSLDRMIEAGLVARSDARDPRRVYYRLTALGQTALRAETERLSRAALVARRQFQKGAPP